MGIRLHGLVPWLMTIGLIMLAGCSQYPRPQEQPRAINGVLDLAEWNFERDGPVELTGEFEFYWQQHVPPDDSHGTNLPEVSGFISVPGSWNGYELAGKQLGGEGYATYRLRVRLREAQPLAFKFLNMGTAFTIHVNGQNLAAAGVPGKSETTTVPGYFIGVVDFVAAEAQLDLVLHLSNFHHRKGGAWEPIRLGQQRDLHAAREKALLVDLFLLGSILIMALYHCGLFAVRREDIASLYFGIFCLLIALRLIATVEIFLLVVFPEMNWELLLKLEYLSFYLAPAVFAMFLRALFAVEFRQGFIRVIQIICAFFSSLVLLTPAKYFSHTILPFQIFTVLSCLCGIYLLTVCAFHKREGAGVFLVGFAILFAAIVNDILDYHGLIHTARIVPLGLFFFIFSQAFVLSFRFSRAFQLGDRQRLELAKINKKYERELGERGRAETALRHSEERYRALFENNPSMYFTVDPSGKILSVNRFGANQLGYTVAELVGQPVLNVFHPEDKSEVVQQLQTCLRNPGTVFHWELRKIHQNGMLLWVKEHAHAVQNVEGNTVVLIVCEDITEHKRMEMAMHESEKLAATGRLAARIAHEINNPLGSIQTAFRLISCAVPSAHRHYHYVNKIEKEIERIARIVRHMLDLYKPGQKALDEFQASEAIADVVTLLKTDSRAEKVKFKLDLQDAFVNVALSESMLRQIMYNLILNAIEASPDGLIHVRAAKEAESLMIIVADQGPGVPEEIRARIFEPFFTTKAASNHRGVGLGLSICKSLVEAMEGRLEMTSTIGKGTEFKISLPVNGKVAGDESHSQII